jgi:histidine triad (HIT) family protein
MKNIFQRIIDGEIPCDKVFENERIIAFNDIAPVAPVHILIVVKKPIENLADIEPEDASLLGEVLLVANRLAKEFGIEEGYRLITNSGETAGQTVFQLHFHLIGGRHLGSLA